MPTVAGANASARKQIQAAYDRMAAGFLRKDANPVFDVLTPDFTNTSPNGARQKCEQFIEEMRGYMAMMKTCAVARLSNQKLAMKSGSRMCAPIEDGGR